MKDKEEIFKILRRTDEARDYIDGLFRNRQASVDASNASTMAVRHVPYILENEKQKRPSTVDEVSPHAERDVSSNGVVSNGAETPKANGQDRGAFPFHSEKERPEMPDRDEFVTAEEIQS
jgi:hypothetical protein